MFINIHKIIHLRVIFILCFVLLVFSCENKIDQCFINNQDALLEIEQIQKLLVATSPYTELNNSKVLDSLNSFSSKIKLKDEKISKNEFSLHLKQILSGLGDRHFFLENVGKCNQDKKYYLPFGLAPWKDNNAIALVKAGKGKFSFFLKNYPYLTHVEDQSLIEFLHQYDPENKLAPKFPSLALGVEKMNEFYKIKKGLNVGDKVRFTFASKDLKSDSTIVLKLVESKNKWRDIYDYSLFEENDSNQLLFKSYENKIAYIKVPKMYSYSEDADYFQVLKKKMQSLKNTNALIIDIRNNSGGNRDLIDFFTTYLIKPNEFEVVNLCKYKGKISKDVEKNLNSRGLYSYAQFKNIKARQAIDDFMKSFHPSIRINEKFYSEYFYMVLNNKAKEASTSLYYDKPIYILTNEMTFSAASVFASVFKGLNNIKIVGVATDGSSGMSNTYNLNYSNIQFNLSSMISFQKNGNLFDGVGTFPDIEIQRSIDQILGNEEHQLTTLLKEINKNIK